MARRSVEAQQARRTLEQQRRVSEVNPKATVNNYTEESYSAFKLFISTNCKYGIIGKEVAPTTGTQHLQIYFHEKKKSIKNTLISKVGIGGFYLEPSRSAEDVNIRYCKKGDKYWEFGELSKNCCRRLEEDRYYAMLMNDIKELNIEELESKYPREMIIHRNQILTVKRAHMLRNMQNSGTYQGELLNINYRIWGLPGIGKSRWAHKVPGHLVYPKAFNKWWDGYIIGDHKVVILDDFPSDEKYLIQHMKIWGDRYPFLCEIEGSSIVMYHGCSKFIITSNHSIEQCFEGISDEDINALKRRSNEIEIKSPDDLFYQSELNSNELIIHLIQ